MVQHLSNEMNFNEYIILSKHIEDNCDGRNNIHILEDIFEGFLGALYSDTNDFKLVERFIIQCIEKHIDFSDVILKDNNYKDQILRYFQHNFKVYPTYHHIEQSEDETEFKCEILKEDDIVCIGTGPTKKKAEQNASYNALVKFNVLT